MGEILAQIYGLGALTTGIYGATRGWHTQLTNEFNKMANGKLDDIVSGAPRKVRPLVQSSLELLPYTVALYTAMKVGEQIARWL